MRERTGGRKLQVWLTRVGYQLIWKSFGKEDTDRDAGMYFFLLYTFLNWKKLKNYLEHLCAFWVVAIAVDWATDGQNTMRQLYARGAGLWWNQISS